MKTQIVMVVFDIHQPEDIQKEYAYKSTIPVEPGTIVVVETKNNGVPTLKLVKVTKVLADIIENATIANLATKYIVDAVDLSQHMDRHHKRERMAFIKNKLKLKQAELEETAVYELLAKSDPESANLLEEMKALILDS